MHSKYITLLIISLTLNIGYSQNEASLFNETQLLKRIETLSSDKFEGRATGQKGNRDACQYIIEQFQSLGVLAFNGHYKQEFKVKIKGKNQKGVNVLAEIKGTDFPKSYIVISAHYDHLGIKNGEIYNGADDDASGVAALFAFAEYFTKNPPKHSVILAAFDAEEIGLKGSKHFVKTQKQHNIILNINMDMISRSPKNELYVVGTRYNKNLKNLISNFKNPTHSKLSIGHDSTDGKDNWTNSSDQAPFHNAKIPFLYFGNEDHVAYHQPTDDFEAITPQFYKNAVTIIISLFKIIDEKSLN